MKNATTSGEVPIDTGKESRPEATSKKCKQTNVLPWLLQPPSSAKSQHRSTEPSDDTPAEGQNNGSPSTSSVSKITHRTMNSVWQTMVKMAA